MKRTMINETSLQEEAVMLMGWVHQVRVLKNITFIVLRDRTGYLQLVGNQLPPLHLEDVIRVEGFLKEGKNKYHGYELHVSKLEVLNQAKDLAFDISKPDLPVTLDTLLKNRVLGLRHESQRQVFKIQEVIRASFRNFFNRKDFQEMNTPKIVANGAEGGAELFTLEYFGKKAYLAQSPQFYKQMMVASGAERVFEIGPVFRAEQHSTTRHLNEYISMDIEMGFIEDEEDLMALETEFFQFLRRELSPFEEVIKKAGGSLFEVPETIPCITYQEGLGIISATLKEEQEDISPEGEKILSAYAKEKHQSDFLFVSAFPKSKRPMYTMTTSKGLTRSFDLLFRGIEITTGGLRIHQYDDLVRSFEAAGLPIQGFQSYLDVFKQGMPPHGGFAIGLERLTMQVLKLSNVRYAALFPRDQQRLVP